MDVNMHNTFEDCIRAANERNDSNLEEEKTNREK